MQLGAPSTLGGCWELFSGLLKEQYALLTNKLSFQTFPALLICRDMMAIILFGLSVCLSCMRICVYFDAIHPTTPPSNSPYPHSQFVCSSILGCVALRWRMVSFTHRENSPFYPVSQLLCTAPLLGGGSVGSSPGKVLVV